MSDQSDSALSNSFEAVKTAFENDSQVQEYDSNALSIFALDMRMRIDNIHEFSVDAITEGRNDKKVDVCHVDADQGIAVVVQSYIARRWGKEAAPANKASDLNTAISWLIAAKIDEVPEELHAKAHELRQLIFFWRDQTRRDFVYP